jgi:hypothetical protein
MATEPKFPPDIFFCPFSDWQDKVGEQRYLIDEDTIRDILDVMHCKTASQAYRRAKLLEVLEQNTSEGRGAEKEVEL